MIKKQKWIFLYALLLTILLFNAGIFMGVTLEGSRVEKINDLYFQTEIELLDQKIQEDALDLMDLDCELLVSENINFADRIFEEALVIQKYEDANKMNQEIIFQHKKFDLLRTLFWMNSIKIKQKCNSDYSNLVYFYDFDDPSLEQESEQRFFSNLLVEIKEEYGARIMLIPIAADNDLPSVNLLLDKYGITEFPAILINEEIIIIEVETKEDVTKHFT
jgi:hypothetical protein